MFENEVRFEEMKIVTKRIPKLFAKSMLQYLSNDYV